MTDPAVVVEVAPGHQEITPLRHFVGVAGRLAVVVVETKTVLAIDHFERGLGHGFIGTVLGLRVHQQGEMPARVPQGLVGQLLADDRDFQGATATAAQIGHLQRRPLRAAFRQGIRHQGQLKGEAGAAVSGGHPGAGHPVHLRCQGHRLDGHSLGLLTVHGQHHRH